MVQSSGLATDKRDDIELILVMPIKSLQYTGGDFMFLYRFVGRRRHGRSRRRCRRRSQTFVRAITFEQLFF